MNNRYVWRALVGVSLLVLTACSSFTLKSNAGHEGFVEEDDWNEETFHGSYWPFSWSGSGSGYESDGYRCKTDSGRLHSVKYQTNVGYALGAVLSLGLWVPEKVEWKCLVAEDDDSDVVPFNGGDEMEDDGPEDDHNNEAGSR
jgi:hypothetical protein